MIGALIPAIIGGVSSLFTGIVGLKQQQVGIITEALKTLQTTVSVAAPEQQASASIIQAEAMSQSWLPRNIRPLILLEVVLAINAIIYMMMTGGLPEAFSQPIPPVLDKLISFAELCVGGYIGGRSFEKIANIVYNWKALQTAIERKIL